MEAQVGDTIHWTLHGFHNRTDHALTNFAIIDMPGRGLNFVSGSLPAFTNSDGVTYAIRYRVAGSNAWRTLASGIDATSPFTFSLPQPGNLHYTYIEIYFGTVPVGFGMGDIITFTFVVSDDAPGGLLINQFLIMHDGRETHGQSPYVPIITIPELEIGDGGVPGGEWVWDDERGEYVWRPDEEELGVIPQTGFMYRDNIFIAILYGSFTAIMAVITVLSIKKYKGTNRRRDE